MKYLFCLFVFTFYFAGVYSQQNANLVSGIIQDSTNGLAMQNVSIQLTGRDNNIHSGISDKNGFFQVPISSAGQYTLIASHTGYKNYSLLIAGAANASHLIIKLQREDNLLGAVTVNATKELETHTASKIVVNVASSAIASGGNSLEAVSRLPGASFFGNTMLFRGRQVQVTIDGKPTGLKDEELKNYLSALPANSIDKIEVLQNPSIKNDAEGSVVINIRTVKNTTSGLTGSITGGGALGRFFKTNIGTLLSYKNKSINAFIGYDYVFNKLYYDGRTAIMFNNGVSLQQNDYEVRERNNHSLRAGIDYSINKLSRISFFFRGYMNYRRRNLNTTTVSSMVNTAYDSSSTVASTGLASYKSPSFNLSYVLKTDTSGSELNISGDYFTYSRSSYDDFHTKYFDQNHAEYKLADLLTASSPAANSVRSISVDWSLNGKYIKLETGIKRTETVIDNDIAWQKTIAGIQSVDSGKTNHYIYHENVNAAYVNVIRSTKTMTLQAGLRVEDTRASGNSLTTAQVTETNYFKLFPSINFQFTLSKGKEIAFGHRRSIQRPAFNILNPFVNYVSQYYYIQGNPLLQPSVNNNINFSYSYKSAFVFSLTYTLSEKPIIGSYQKNPEINGVISTNINGSYSHVLSPNITISRKFYSGKWVTVNNIGMIYTHFNDREKYNFGYSSALSGYASSTNTVGLGKGCSVELTGNYTSATIQASEKFRPQYSVNTGINLPLFKSNGNLKISVVDLFNTQVFKYTAINTVLRNNYYYKIETRFLNVGFTYKFGKNNIKVNTNRKTGIDEEKSRI